MSDDLVVGATFASRYRIERRIAAGGMGAVYEVVHFETNRRCALKVMHPDLVQNDESRDRFRQEARVTAQIDSEYIVDVFDAGIDESTGVPYLVMELLQGEEVSKRIKRLERLSSHDTVLYLHQAALALDKTHRACIVHRDLKPDNLYLCERDDGPPRIKLLDFGIAKIVTSNAASSNSTQAVGTPLYMAPEQFLLDAAVSSATDLYALGMIAYTMLVGQTYWLEESKKGANVFAFATHVTLGPQEKASVRALRSGVTLSSSFDDWFARATARKPAARFPTATAMIAALAEALELPSPTSILALAYADASDPSFDVPRASLAPRSLSTSQLGSARTTKDPRNEKNTVAAIGGIAVATVVLSGLLYTAFTSSSTSDKANANQTSSDATASVKGLSEVVPIASMTPPPQEPRPTSPEATKSPSNSVTQTPVVSAPKNTSAPTSTVKTKKQKWIRD